MNARRQPNAAERVEMMLSVLPWLAAQSGPVAMTEVADKFGADPGRLRDDLMAVFLDVEPIVGPDHMVVVDLDEESDEVSVTLPGSFEQPPRLDHTEALHLLAAGIALAEEPGADAALSPAVAKLTEALGPSAVTALQIDLGRGDPGIRQVVRDALLHRKQLEITYFAWSSDAVTTRRVDPWAVRSFEGQWYLSGFCHESDGMRHFRLDRVLAAEAVGESAAFDVPEQVEEPAASIGEGGQLVRFRIAPHAAWLVQSHPIEEWHDDGDTIDVTMRIHNNAWLDRLLVRLGPDATAEDLSTGESLLPRRVAAAERILQRYRQSDSNSGDR